MQLGQIPLKNYLCFNKIYGEFGSLTHYDYGFRIYNPGIGKFLSVDPLTQSYPWYTPYQFAGNTPIWANDLDGLEEAFATDYYDEKKGQYRRKIIINENRDSKDIGTIQFKYSDGTSSNVLTNTNERYQEVINSMIANWDHEGHSFMLAGPTTEVKPIIQNTTEKIVKEKIVKPEGNYKKSNIIDSSHPIKTNSIPIVKPITSDPPVKLPDGYLQAKEFMTKGDGYIKGPNFESNSAEIAQWLIRNPSYSLVYSTGAGVPNGKQLNDEVKFDFITYTYKDRIEDAITTMINGIVEASNEVISRDRIKIEIGDINSNIITKPKVIKND